MKIEYLSPEGVLEVEQAALREIERKLPREWYGFAAFQLVVPRTNPLDIDLLVLTGNRILVVELKNWSGEIESSNGQWIHKGTPRKSPVLVTTSKARALVDPLRSALGGTVPYIEPLIVLCHPLAKPKLDSRDKQFTLTLAEFCALTDNKKYLERYPLVPRPGGKASINPLSALGKYKLYFSPHADHIRKLKLAVHGYQQDTEVADFEHPKGLFHEFLATHKESRTSKGLLRRWDFSTLAKGNTSAAERSNIALREVRLNEHVRLHSDELHRELLEPVGQPTSDDVTTNFTEIYRLAPKLERLDAFLNRREKSLTYGDRLELVKAVVNRYSQLHRLGIAHRDISMHSLWVEEPCRVVMSSFATAYFPEQETVSQYRVEIETGAILLPEDSNLTLKTTPFCRDVFLLAAVAFQVLTGRRPHTVEGIPSFDGFADQGHLSQLESWFATAMSWEPAARFKDAEAALDRLVALTSTKGNTTAITSADFEQFKTQASPMTYAMSEQIGMVDGKWVYRSSMGAGSYLVKIWSALNFDEKRPVRNLKLLEFLETTRSMHLNPSPDYATIVDYGLGPMGLVLVTQWVSGRSLSTWLKEVSNPIDRAKVALELMRLVARLHANGLSHGDIKPQNIVVRDVSGDQVSLALVDIPDLQPNGDDGHTPAFSTPELTGMPARLRDLFAAAKTVELVLFTVGSGFEKTRAELERALHEAENGVPLDIVASTLEAEMSPDMETSEPLSFVLEYPGRIPNEHDGRISGDNGKFYVSIDKSRRDDNGVVFNISGIRHRLELHVNVENGALSWVNVREHGHIDYVKRVANSDFILEGEITVRWSAVNGAEALVTYLLQRAKDEQVLNIRVSDSDTSEDARVTLLASDTSKHDAVNAIRTRDLWRVMAKCEQENATAVTVLPGAVIDPNNPSRYFVPFELDAGTLDFSKDEDVHVLMKYYDAASGEVKWRPSGKLNPALTNAAQLVIEDVYPSFSTEEGTEYRLRSRLEEIAIWRRQQAIERVLSDRSLLTKLPDVFDPQSVFTPTEIDSIEGVDITKYGLNEEQTDALLMALRHGPVSLLQGPPGTGKTKFISAFIHCVLANGLARNVLLVSQSHEAINHALAKTSQLAKEHQTPFSMVRVGQENMLADNIRPLHDLAQQQRYRENFSSEIKARIARAGEALGLPAAYITEAVDLYLNVGHLVERIKAIDIELNRENVESVEELITKKSVLLATLRSITVAKYQHVISGADFETSYSEIRREIGRRHGVSSPATEEKLERLVKLSHEFREVLGNPRANFTTFLTRSCQIVAGTCVGIGRHSMGIVDHTYDWVVIDEAARSSPTELAVAMQAGKRILLVGDHKQLPPTYAPDFQRSVARGLGLSRIKLSAFNDFERAFQSEYGKRCGRTLYTQYRMAPAIGTLVSECFYDGKLKTGRSIPGPEYELIPRILSHELTWVDTSDMGTDAYDSKPDGSESRINEVEANAVLSVLRTIAESDAFIDAIRSNVEESGPPIGVICMYAAQRDLIRHRFNQADWAAPIRELVKIGTVDSYQGKENRIILLSLVCNNSEGDIGFLNRPERINVALSRAMDRLAIFGATAMWRERRGAPLFKVVEEVFKMHKEGNALLQASKAVVGGRT